MILSCILLQTHADYSVTQGSVMLVEERFFQAADEVEMRMTISLKVLLTRRRGELND